MSYRKRQWLEVEVPLALINEACALRLSRFLEQDMGSLSSLFAERLTQAIRDAGFSSIDAFGRETGISRAVLSKALSGKSDVRLTTIERIAEALCIPPASLLEVGPTPHGQTKRPMGRPVSVDVVVKVRLPANAAVPAWVREACKGGVELERKQPKKSKAPRKQTKP